MPAYQRTRMTRFGSVYKQSPAQLILSPETYSDQRRATTMKDRSIEHEMPKRSLVGNEIALLVTSRVEHR